MFSPHFTLRKPLAVVLSMCLLWLLLSCVAVCADHLEESSAPGSYSVSEPCGDDRCPMTASAASSLPERSFFASGFDEDEDQAPSALRAETAPDERARHILSPFSPGPLLERFRLLRI